MKKLFVCLLIINLICSATTTSFAGGMSVTKETYSCVNTNNDPGSDKSGDEISESKNKKRLGADEFLRDTAIYYTSIWLFRLFYVRNKNSRIFDTSISDWLDNIFSVPVWDDGDDFVTNYIAHPFAGYMSYLYYRQMEHDFWMSALGSVVQSTLFEYTVEGTVERPSGVDLIMTPLIGVPIGFMADITSDWLMEKDNIFAEVAARLINPMRNVVKDRQLVLFNPVKGSFEYTGEFSMFNPPAKKKSIDLGYPLFFESAIPQGYFEGYIEVADLEDKFGGAFIMYHIKAEFPSENNLYSVYLKVSQAGVDDVNEQELDTRDGFEFANAKIGWKYMVYKSGTFVVTVGEENTLPTAYKDNIDRLESLLYFRRDYPTFLRNSLTLSPYLSTVYFRDGISIHANLGMDNVLWADKLEGDFYEGRFKYSAAVGYNIPYQYSPVLYTEFNGYMMFTEDTFDKNDLFFTTGLRFGGKYGPGVAVQVPVSGATDDVVKASFIADIRIRF